MEDRRKRNRCAVNRFVGIVVEDRSYRGTISDLTEDGCYIQTRGSYSVGDNILITHELEDDSKEIIRRYGIIKRVTQDGIGVGFRIPGYWKPEQIEDIDLIYQ